MPRGTPDGEGLSGWCRQPAGDPAVPTSPRVPSSSRRRLPLDKRRGLEFAGCVLLQPVLNSGSLPLHHAYATSVLFVPRPHFNFGQRVFDPLLKRSVQWLKESSRFGAEKICSHQAADMKLQICSRSRKRPSENQNRDSSPAQDVQTLLRKYAEKANNEMKNK